MDSWPPENWNTLSQDERKADRAERRRSMLLHLKTVTDPLVDPMIRAAEPMVHKVGAEKHDWVVGQVQDAVDKIAAAPGPWAEEIESDGVTSSPYFRGLIDGWTDEAFERMKSAGELDTPDGVAIP